MQQQGSVDGSKGEDRVETARPLPSTAPATVPPWHRGTVLRANPTTGSLLCLYLAPHGINPYNRSFKPHFRAISLLLLEATRAPRDSITIKPNSHTPQANCMHTTGRQA